MNKTQAASLVTQSEKVYEWCYQSKGLYAGIDLAIAANLPQMELYLTLGRLVSSRTEKGAAVIAAEYITSNYPDQTGFSPRNLRRMRDIFRMYEEYPKMLEQAVKVGWTQNVVIMESDLDMDARY